MNSDSLVEFSARLEREFRGSVIRGGASDDAQLANVS